MSKKIKIILVVFLLLAIGGGGAAIYAYKTIFEPNTQKDKDYEVFLETSITTDSLVKIFKADTVLKNYNGFVKIAAKKKVVNLKPGHYVINPGMSNNQIINMFRAGLQTPVKVTFIAQPSIRAWAGVIDKQILPDSAEIYNYIVGDFSRVNNIPETELPAYFIPNTYEVYWNISAENWGKRMLTEYHRFWSEENLAKAKNAGLTPVQVSTLASIVEGETNKTKEMPTVAGLYLNRLKKNQKLESDPTIRYCIKQKNGWDYKVKRVLYKDLEIDSPYNTYLYVGLPPGPLSVPSVQAIKAVLNAESHNYIFMCADPATGYHKFTNSYSQHLRNRDAYKKWLNENKIYR